jgi:hypothetical protein
MQDDDLWLTVDQKVGVLPAQLEISARTETLPPGKYRGTVLITAPAAQPITRSIAVELTIP